MRSYRRVTYQDRCQIKAYLRTKTSQSEIARLMGFHKSTICRELKRNNLAGCSAFEATKLSKVRKKSCRRKERLKGELLSIVLDKLDLGWSPEQICGRLRREQSIRLSPETIYRYVRKDKVNGGDLEKAMRRPKKRSKGRYLVRKYKPAWMKSISERPNSVNRRENYNHWERDSMLGLDRQHILVCVERKSRYTLLSKIGRPLANNVGHETISLLSKVSRPVYSITNDNGAEFRDAYMFNIPVYYCKPHKPQQRGTVENTIGLLRQYIGKKADIRSMTDEQIKQIENRLNNRPRKVLDYKTPYEVYEKKNVALVN